jgi:DNA-binding CsgD family transcriptional regulator
MGKHAALYGLVLAGGTFALQWLDYLSLVRVYPRELFVFAVAAAFLGLGVFVGMRGLRGPAPLPFDGNPKAAESLGLSARELEVLREIAAGHSNKDIARVLEVSPNTVKTHVSHVYEKLGAKRRTDALRKARELGLLP